MLVFGKSEEKYKIYSDIKYKIYIARSTMRHSPLKVKWHEVTTPAVREDRKCKWRSMEHDRPAW